MTSKTVIVWSCGHADPQASNERFNHLGNLIYDIKPDYCIDLGDGADMRSLNSFDTTKPTAVVAESYEKDIESYLDSQERLRHLFKKHKRKLPKWYGFEGNHCLPKGTEVLCHPNEWKLIEDTTTDDVVLTLDGWQQVQNTLSRDYDGVGYSFGDTSVVTEDHRVYYYNGSGKLDVKKAKDVPQSLDMPVSTLTGSGIDYTVDQLEFMAIALTDSYHGRNDLVFYQSGNKAQVFRDLLDRLGVEYKETARNRDITHICGKELKSVQTGYEFHLKGGYDWNPIDQNKAIPDFLYSMSQDQFEVFLEMMVFCDGSIPTRATSSRVFYGKKKICDDMQALCVTHGYRASLTEYRENRWRVNICKAYKRRVAKKEEQIKGEVYCLSVPSLNFMARQGQHAFFTGNCHRIKRALSYDPRLEGSKYGISFKHLETNRWFNEYHEYENSAPSIGTYDGVDYSHFFNTGNSPNATSGIHHAYTLLQKRHRSSVCGHSHFRNIYFSDGMGAGTGKGLIGMVVGCMKGREESWAGQGQKGWWKGAVVLRNVEDGYFEPEFVSQQQMREAYD